ncbi:Zinc finger protein 775 [Araneus ventricosus]|uniref:Zinc finger protein 775 n=1 Tax=Araneus ventricosus TaxID=182803 RepID=A0A4Y2BAS8_ARAVE|nr:Zinc finger protein 775 [Araneus ventricosus]
MLEPIATAKSTAVQSEFCRPWTTNSQLIVERPQPLVPWDVTLQRLQQVLWQSAEDKKFRCLECPMVFSILSQYTDHLMIHKKRPFGCPTCMRCFMRKVELLRHERIHTGEKRFRCPECFKPFGRKDHMKKHFLTHLKSYEAPNPNPESKEVIEID